MKNFSIIDTAKARFDLTHVVPESFSDPVADPSSAW